MPATYEPIASTTLGSNAADVTFSSLGGTFTDLRIVVRAQTSHTSHSALRMQFNSDTATNYSYTRLYGNGTTASSDRFSNDDDIDAGFLPPSTAGIGTSIIDVFSYANSSVHKTCLIQWETQAGASGNQYVAREVGLWRSTSAITAVKLFFASGNIVSGSTFSLYGIKAA